MIVTPKVKGFICTTAHPQGCKQLVAKQISYVQQQPKLKFIDSQRVLVIGASTGYGLASRISASFGAGAKTIGVFFERSATDKRTASAGWYNSVAFEQAAAEAGIYAKSVNGDAFSTAIKQQVIDLIKRDWPEGVNLIIYSLASPRRQHPETSEVFQSVLKPIGKPYNDKTVNILDGLVSTTKIEPASDLEVEHTVKVMGGEDWELWIRALSEAKLLSKRAVTIAYSYIGPELTYPIYRNGTIGKAKEHLEQTALKLDKFLQTKYQGRALISVNKALVTQASSAIPVVPLYISLLYKVMKAKHIHENCIEQIYRLFKQHLAANARYNVHQGLGLDEKNRIRMDDLELRADVQQEVRKLWQTVASENLAAIADLAGYRREFYNLFGFEIDGVDYTADVETDLTIPSIPVAPPSASSAAAS